MSKRKQTAPSRPLQRADTYGGNHDQEVVSGEVSISIPLSEVPSPEWHIPRHVDVMLTRGQGTALQWLRHNLDRHNVRLRQSGRVIANNSEAVRYLLELIEEKVEAARSGIGAWR